MKATKVLEQISESGAEQKCYRLSESIKVDDGKETNYVIVSAVVAYSGPETYIFPSNELGEITDYGELEGSFRGALNHEQALKGLGVTEIE